MSFTNSVARVSSKEESGKGGLLIGLALDKADDIYVAYKARSKYDEGKGVASPPCFVLILLSLLVWSGCGSSQSNSGSPAALKIVDATDIGAISTNPDILGRDGAYSALFQGYSVWLYGDTFLANPNADGFSLISDSWSYTTNLNAQNGITGFQEGLDSSGAPSMILTLTPDELAFNLAHNGNPCQQQPCGERWALWPASIVPRIRRRCS